MHSDPDGRASSPQVSVVLERPELEPTPEADAVASSPQVSVVLERPELEPTSEAEAVASPPQVSVVLERPELEPTPEAAAVASPPTQVAAPASVRRIGLPARPRLRLTFGWDGKGEMTCEGVLMDERRELVAREQFDPKLDLTVAQCFSYFASRLVQQVRQSGAVVYVQPSATPPAEATAPASSSATQPPEGCVCSRGSFDENGLCTVCGGKNQGPPGAGARA